MEGVEVRSAEGDEKESSMKNKIVQEDLQYIHDNYDFHDFFTGSTILITGCAGFLGYYFMQYFVRYAKELGIKKIIALDNFKLFGAQWLENLAKESGIIDLHAFDVISGDINSIKDAEKTDIIIHMASIASPTFYRKYPIEALDANVWGLRKLLNYYREKTLKGFLFFSSSEIYGDPFPEFIPTGEEYLGNVATIGPRACYDEAKRFGETLCYLYADHYNLPISIVRPFNNYGPGLRLDDKRLPADFAKAVFENKDINIFSDGTPTRTFCYISDAILGYLKTLAHNKFDYFNIGMDIPEISIREIAEVYVETARGLFGYTGNIKFKKPDDKEYLTNNPHRRCPKINKARNVLNYNPTILPQEGVKRFLKFIKINQGVL